MLGFNLGFARPHREGFNLAAFMAGQSDGFWYDFGQTDRLFQESVGPTPADGAGEPIGLALSQRTTGAQSLAQALGGAAERAAPFVPAGTGWSVSGNDATHVVTFGTGTVRYQSDVTAPTLNLAMPGAFVIGRTYALTFDVVSRVSGTLKISAQNGVEPSFGGSTGLVTLYITATSTPLTLQRNSASVDITLGNLSIREVSRYPATQITAGSRPAFQSTGAVFDGIDDNLVTGYVPGVGANFIVAKVTVPASIAAIAAMFGCSAGTADRFWFAVNTNGTLAAGLGTTSTSGTIDTRGRTVTVGISCDGTTGRIFVDNALDKEFAQSGSPTYTLAMGIGANRSNNSPGSYWTGSIKNIVAGREFINLARFNQIASRL